MYKFAINRPVATLMIFVSLVFFGIFSIKTMSINLFPEIEIPLVKITTYANGDKEYINNKITKKLEDELSSIDGIKNLNSYSYSGLSVIVVEFNLKKDIQIALNDARDKISKANLPFKSVTEKISGSDQPIFSIFVSHKDNNTTALMRVIDNKARGFLQRINGVLNVSEVGFLKPVVSIKLDVNKLNKFSLNTAEVANIIATQNLKSPLGIIKNDNENLVIKSNFDAKSIDELGEIRLRDGLFLKDIASVDYGYLDKDSLAIMNGKSGVMLNVKKISSANTLKTIARLNSSLDEFKKMLGSNYDVIVAFDKSELVLKHIKQVAFDMILGVVLTAIIVFVFLRNFNATFIATLSVPISIIATFFFINLLGYDINRLTLIALTLGIGVFIDDAIVVVENITKKLQSGQNALMASLNGIKEIAFSVFAISAVLLCVFVPIAFMDGIVGRYFNSFAMSVSAGVVVSFVVCVMLVPSLCARFISADKGAIYLKTERFFKFLDDMYESLLDLILKFKALFLIFVLAILSFCMFLALKVGGDFMPSEDNSEFNIFLKADPNISLSAMSDKAKPILNELNLDKRVMSAYLLIGYDDASSAYKAKIYVKLKPLNEREKRQNEIMAEYRNAFKFNDLTISITDLPIVDVGDNEPFALTIKGESFDKLEEIFLRIKQKLLDFGGVVDIKSPNEDKSYQVEVGLHKQKIKKLGIDELNLAEIISRSFLQKQVSIFDDGLNQYDIVLSFSDEFKNNLEDLKSIKVKNIKGDTFMLKDIATFELKKDILLIPRNNKENQIKILANLDNIPLGAVVDYIVNHLDLPEGYSYKFSGFVELMDDTNRAFIFTISLSAVLIYMILAALYESFLMPFIIMLSMPLAFGGVGLGLFLSGNSFSLFVMVGAILLFGMVGKNAILVVDFANKFANDGMQPDEAVKKAGVKRLHAILMTTFAMIFAMLPLALSKGAGYEANSPMAIAIIFGLISSTILTLLVIPAIFSLVYKFDKKLRKFYQKEMI